MISGFWIVLQEILNQGTINRVNKDRKGYKECLVFKRL